MAGKTTSTKHPLDEYVLNNYTPERNCCAYCGGQLDDFPLATPLFRNGTQYWYHHECHDKLLEKGTF